MHNPLLKLRLLKRTAVLIASLWLVAIFLHLVKMPMQSGRMLLDSSQAAASKKSKDQQLGLMKVMGLDNIRLQFLNAIEYDYTNLVENDSKDSFTTKERYLKELRFESDNSHLPPVSCAKIIEGDRDEIEQVKLKTMEFNSKQFAPHRELFNKFDDEIVKEAENCHQFIKWRKYITTALSQEEQNFPIAYVITIHKKLKEFERLLRAIYRPNNIYCVHVDRKASSEFQRNVSRVTSCFENVFLVSQQVDVHYSHYSRVQADLNCLRDLKKKRNQVAWKYVINLCGQDFPLKTNYDIVKSLQMLYGSNNLETVAMPEHKKVRYLKRFRLPVNNSNSYAVMEPTNERKEENPLKSKMFAGSAYYVFSWRAINFILTDPRVAEFLEWNKDTYSPDEHIWATLQRWHPFVPGSFPPHSKYDRNELISLPRLVKWAGLEEAYPTCAGKFSRGVCVYGVGDITWLLTQAHLFANKFDFSTDPFAIHCLDNWLRNRTIAQALRRDFPQTSTEPATTIIGG